MKFWVMAIFSLSNRLEQLCEAIEKRIDYMSLSLAGDTYQLLESVLALNDKKVRVINFKVLGGMMKEKLSDAEHETLRRHIQGETFAEIGQAVGVSKSTAARRLDTALAKCASVAGSLTFTEERLINEYRDIPLIFRTVQRFERQGKRGA